PPRPPPAGKFFILLPAISWCRPRPRGSIILGRSASYPTAACWSPNAPGACALSPETARSLPRSPACRKSSPRAREVCSTSCSIAASRRITRSISVYAEPVDGGARTALARARLFDEGTPRLEAVEVIFRQAGPLSSGNHFGCRIVQTADDNLFLTTGEHFTTRDQAQNLGNHLGKIIRIQPDGSVPADNPFVGKAAAK